jgi:hypothetical protein
MSAGKERPMRAGRFSVAGLAAYLGLAATVSAQFGHPLKGTWSGEWGATRDKQTHVVLELNWDGKVITGRINPGPTEVPLRSATLDPSSWSVHLEAERKDPSGGVIRYVIDGKLENIGAYQRLITGTWSEGPAKGDFKVVRN